MIITKRQQGFTIVELLIVIVVIAILTTISIVTFSGVQRRASEAASSSAINAAQKKLELYKIANGAYPTTLAAAEVSNASTTYQYTVDGTGTTYCVTATTNKSSMYGSNTQSSPTSGGCAGHSVNGVAPATNYALNPSGEAGLAGGWSGTVSTAQAYKGTQSISYTAAATPTDTFVNLNVSVPSAGTYYISAYIYITSNAASFSGGSCGSGRDMMWLNGVTWAYPCINRSLLNQWQRVQNTVTIPGTATFPVTMQLRFYPPGGSTIYVDGVMVSNASSAYADGSSAGWIWNGAANASTSSGQPQ